MSDPWSVPRSSNPREDGDEDEIPFDELEGAGFGIRAGARIIDFVASAVFDTASGMALGVVLVLVNPSLLDKLDGGLDPVTIAAGIVSGALAPAVAEWGSGATLGKLIVGVRVVSRRRTRLTFVQALFRNGMYYIDSLFCGLVAYFAMDDNPLHQRMGDKAADTVVLFVKDVPGSLRATADTVAIWVAAGLAVRAGIDVVAMLVSTLV